MKDTIQKELAQIEQTQNVRILLAVESGSRAWGFASPDSDYDVRFIYVRPKDAYLRLQKHRDVIELPINDALDINGWDLTKTLRLLHKSNPTLFEWGASPIVYLGQHRTIAEASAVESPIRQETIGFPAHFFARAHNFKPPGRACQPEADSPMRT